MLRSQGSTKVRESFIDRSSNRNLLNRKNFFKGVALGTISLPVILRGILGKTDAQNGSSANIISGQTLNWKMVNTWPPNFPVLGQACQLYADVVQAMSGGRINIRVYGGGELVPPLEAFDAVRSGVAEVGNGAAYYWAGKAPAAQFFASVPFGMNAQQLNAWMISGGGLALWEELYRDFGLVPFPGGNTGVQMGGWFNREINTIDDLKGLKMRIPGLGGKVLEKAGGSPVLLAGGEIYTGLERGVIDATEWLGPFHDQLMGFHEIARYYYTPGWHEPGTELEFFINKEKFDGLSADLQAIFRSAALHVNLWCLSEMEARNAAAFAEFRQQGIDIRSFPEPVLKQLRQFTREVIDEMIQGDPFTRRVYASYEAFREKASAYSTITEIPYYQSIQAVI